MTETGFWERVLPPATPDDCALWTGALTGAGYGALRWGGRVVGAHVVAWVLTRGPVPTGMHVLHHCDNPPCVAHLFVGTNSENIADMESKGRRRPALGASSGYRKHPESFVGIRALTKAETAEVGRLLLEGITQREIAIELGVSQTTISRRKYGYTRGVQA